MSDFRGQRVAAQNHQVVFWTSSAALWDVNGTAPLQPPGTGMTFAQTDLNGTTLRPDMERSVNVESQ